MELCAGYSWTQHKQPLWNEQCDARLEWIISSQLYMEFVLPRAPSSTKDDLICVGDLKHWWATKVFHSSSLSMSRYRLHMGFEWFQAMEECHVRNSVYNHLFKIKAWWSTLHYSWRDINYHSLWGPCKIDVPKLVAYLYHTLIFELCIQEWPLKRHVHKR